MYTFKICLHNIIDDCIQVCGKMGINATKQKSCGTIDLRFIDNLLCDNFAIENRITHRVM